MTELGRKSKGRTERVHRKLCVLFESMPAKNGRAHADLLQPNIYCCFLSIAASHSVYLWNLLFAEPSTFHCPHNFGLKQSFSFIHSYVMIWHGSLDPSVLAGNLYSQDDQFHLPVIIIINYCLTDCCSIPSVILE